LATAGALVFTALQAYSAQQQTRVAQQQAAAAQEQNLTQTLGQAVEQLGSEQISVRLLGIHTLGRLLRDSPPNRVAIFDGLEQFIHDETARRPPPPPGKTFINLSADVQLALDVLTCRRTQECSRDNNPPVRLPGADLTGADLVGANLTGAILFGANLTGADLVGANLTGAELVEANLTRADLHRANLTDARLSVGTLLFGANPPATVGLTQAQVDEACTNENTKLPPGLHGHACPAR
jgi:hypothetical protein